jgi:hypothetical protein
MHNFHQYSAGMKVGSRRGYEMEITICVLRNIWGFVITYILNPFVTSGTYNYHLQRVFSSPLR